MPIEESHRADSKFPWFTTLTVLATLGFSLYFFMDRRSPDYYGFIPREFDRNGGLTFLSSFFVHGGWVHLLTNMYFLFVFGRVVEDKIGGWLFLILLTLSTASGNILTLCFEPQSDIPHVGASGGIAGVLIFYGLTFPRNKIVFFMAGTYGLMMPRLIRIPAWAALLLWVLIQFFGASFQSAGMSTVSYSSHLGGLGLGLAFWLLWKWITGGRQGRDRGYNDPKSGKGASKRKKSFLPCCWHPWGWGQVARIPTRTWAPPAALRRPINWPCRGNTTTRPNISPMTS